MPMLEDAPPVLFECIRPSGKSLKALREAMKNSDPNTAGPNSWAPLHWMANSSNHAWVKALLDGGADPNVITSHGKTPLMFAAEMKTTKSLKLLVDGGADVNRQDNNGTTALHRACDVFNFDGATMLLDAGASPALANNLGKRPVDRNWGSPGSNPRGEALVKRMSELCSVAGSDFADGGGDVGKIDDDEDDCEGGEIPNSDGDCGSGSPGAGNANLGKRKTSVSVAPAVTEETSGARTRPGKRSC